MKTNLHNNNHHTTADNRLRQLLDEARNATDAPPSPWFTRKVMNRLPPQKIRTAAMAEYMVYIIAALATIIFTVVYGIRTYASGTVTVGDLCIIACSTGLLLAILNLMLTPWLHPLE